MTQTDAPLPFFTIGHSNRSLELLIGLLRANHVELLMDIRKIPMSRANPQFNHKSLPASLAPFQIAYEHNAALGGLRGKSQKLPSDINSLWRNASFHNYADYALSAEFHAGLDHLRRAGQKRRCAIMCSEAVWWRCHRRFVADYLLAAGEEVFHIMGENRLEPAHLTPGAVIKPDGTIHYPATSQA